MSLKLPERPVEPPPDLLIADTQWGVLHSAHTAGGVVDVKDDEASARGWLHALRFCGNSDAVLVAKVAGDPKAVWIPVDGAA